MQPTFKSGVEVLAVDVHVVDKKGTPVRDLLATDFEVVVGGQRRRVLSANLIVYGSAGSTANGGRDISGAGRSDQSEPAAPVRPGCRRTQLHPGNAMAAVRAAERFIARLDPTDFVSVYAYPSGVVQDDFTNDHAAAKQRLGKVMGLYPRGGEPIQSISLRGARHCKRKSRCDRTRAATGVCLRRHRMFRGHHPGRCHWSGGADGDGCCSKPGWVTRPRSRSSRRPRNEDIGHRQRRAHVDGRDRGTAQ